MATLTGENQPPAQKRKMPSRIAKGEVALHVHRVSQILHELAIEDLLEHDDVWRDGPNNVQHVGLSTPASVENVVGHHAKGWNLYLQPSPRGA